MIKNYLIFTKIILNTMNGLFEIVEKSLNIAIFLQPLWGYSDSATTIILFKRQLLKSKNDRERAQITNSYQIKNIYFDLSPSQFLDIRFFDNHVQKNLNETLFPHRVNYIFNQRVWKKDDFLRTVTNCYSLFHI